MLRSVIGSLGFVLTLMLAAVASAWEEELARLVRPIAEVQEKAEPGDFVVVEGEVADVTTGNGSLVIVIFRDASGSVPLAVPNSLLRHLAGGGPAGGSGPDGVDPKVGARARVGGRWDHKHMDDRTWGIRVQRVERIED
jgi:hypothetical protein